MSPSTTRQPTAEDLLFEAQNNGLGMSLNDPIILPKRNPNDYVSEEYWIARELLERDEVLTPQLSGQELLHVKNKSIDKLTFRLFKITESGTRVLVRDYFFDITDCIMPRVTRG